MNIGKRTLVGQSPGLAASFVERIAVQHHFSAELPATRHFHQRRETRHHDCHWYAQQAPMPSQPQGVIAGGRRNGPQPRLLRRQLRQGVARSPFLEAPRPLKVLLFTENARSGQLTQRRRFRAWRADDRAIQARAGFHDLRKRNFGNRIDFHWDIWANKKP
jgi:hypothetical protein